MDQGVRSPYMLGLLGEINEQRALQENSKESAEEAVCSSSWAIMTLRVCNWGLAAHRCQVLLLGLSSCGHFCMVSLALEHSQVPT